MTISFRSAAPLYAPSSARRIPALQGLRGAAFLGVLRFHTGVLAGGFLGVDLFFVLSGYLITGLLLREASQTGSVALIAFWGRRCRRLLPALVLMLVVVTLVVCIIGAKDLLRTALGDGPWVQANLLNWHLLAESASYWDDFGDVRVFEHLWSIAVEEQFYLVWPLVVFVVARWTRRPDAAVLVIAGAGAVASVLAMALLTDPSDPTRAYTGTDTRAFALLLGAVAVTGPVRRRIGALADRMGNLGRDVTLVLLISVVVASWLLVDGTDSTWLYPGGLLAHSAVAALLIALLAQSGRRGPGRLLEFPPVQLIGDLSYSLYLWHWPVIVVLSWAVPRLDGWALTLVTGAVSFVAALASRSVIEDRVRFRATWARGRSGLLALILLMAALALFWVVVPQPAGPVIDVDQLGSAR
ncbi:acyltransferase family protein [Microbacterium sp. 179-I 3D3 NHS]|uniref:acyltransferase family protein n=1 Tax=Microbacterium sp. 179-I 3D3 NHS TaxID=3142382 RepID=UPI0039A2C0C4